MAEGKVCSYTGKVCHTSRKKAERHLARLKQVRRGGVPYQGTIFHCWSCGSWHLGTRKPKVARGK